MLLADIHLGAPLPEWGPHAPRRREEARAAWSEAMRTAADPAEGIAAVLVAGDLFDRPDPPEEEVRFAWEATAPLGDAGIPLVVVPGYFDGLTHPAAVHAREDLPGHVTVVRTPSPSRAEVSTPHGPLQIYGFTWIPGLTPEDPWTDFGKDPETAGPHVGLLHADLRMQGEAASLDMVPALVPDTLEACGLDLVVLGRSHEYGEFRIGGTTAVYPGSPVGLTYGEWGDRFLVTADVGSGETAVHTRVREVRPVITETYHIPTGHDADAIAADLRERFAHAAMARIRLQGEVAEPLDLDALAAAVSADGPVVHLIDDTELLSGEDTGDEPSVRDEFVRALRERIDAAENAEERDTLRRALRIGLMRFRRLEDVHAH